MNKTELLEVFEMLDIETLENLYFISKVFKPEELKNIAQKVQDENIKKLIINYL